MEKEIGKEEEEEKKKKKWRICESNEAKNIETEI